ncbi:hypothetical protein M011DRAFT_469422, partial [Sporormia fimetaria CBS 119925]
MSPISNRMKEQERNAFHASTVVESFFCDLILQLFWCSFFSFSVFLFPFLPFFESSMLIFPLPMQLTPVKPS